MAAQEIPFQESGWLQAMCVPKEYCFSQLCCLPDGQNLILSETLKKVYGGAKRICVEL